MSKNKEKDTLANPFAKLSKMDFPDKDTKKSAQKNARSEGKKQKISDIPPDIPPDISYDDDVHLFLASIGEVNKLSSNKKVHADFSAKDNAYADCTMAELLEKSTQQKKEEKSVEKQEQRDKAKQAAKKIVIETKQEKQDVNEDDLNDFYKAMQDVKTLEGKGREIIPCIKENTITPPPVVNPLQEFMEGKLEFSLCATEDYIEGHIVGIDLMTVGKLQNRQYSPEAHIDLHGLNAEQAYHNLIAFFRNSYQRGLRTVLVVTGKGKNSINGMPVLRNKVQEWFTKDPFRRVILAFCTAKQEDGGTGALYVLIRKQKKNYGKVHWDLTPTDSDFFL